MRQRGMRLKDSIPDKNVIEALEYIKKGNKIGKTSRKFGISEYRLRKYFSLHCEAYSDISQARNSSQDMPTIFTVDQENTLKEHLKYFESLFHGITETECRILTYQMALMNDLNIPESWNNGMAASEWLCFFKKYNPDLTLEKPVRCWDRNRSWGWNFSSDYVKTIYVNGFYDNLEKLLTNPKFKNNNSRIFTLGGSFLSESRKKKADKESNDDLITTCCIVSADGRYLPPIKIVSHTFSKDDAGPSVFPRSLTLVAPRGRMNMYTFPEVIQQFIELSNTSPENPSVLIMDTEMCHISIAAFDLAKTSGVHILTIHPHFSKILQPLKAGLIDLFQTNYYAGLDSWYEKAKSQVPRKETTPDIIEIISEAYTKAMTPENIINAFSKCGIIPYDRDLLTDSDYVSCGIVDPPCYDCKIRDNRGKRPDKVCTDVAEENESGTSSTPQEVSENIASSNSVEQSTEDLTKSGDSKDESENLAQHGKLNSKKQQKSQPAGNHSSEMSQQQRGAELDKLKRRMIRTVARLLREKKTEDEVWEELKKESGSVNCKNLWERMRSLTMKKLKRLLAAEDRVEFVPTVARMTLTDWLLYDLVIVHEKIDVIDRNQSPENKVLTELFSLVEKFSIEGRSGDELAEAWTAATVHYNSKGHQCSPMLMQRRWYQIKELTRHKLYQFWFNYRGNVKLLNKALEDPPTELQKNIALRYPEIITAPFPDWNERIENKLVIMPEEFEVKMRCKRRQFRKPVNNKESAPDVIILEPKIDTITIGDSESEYSDEESSRSSMTSATQGSNAENDETIPIIVQVKSEPQDDIDTIEHTPYQTPSEERKDRFQAEIERLRLVEDTILINEEKSDDIEPELPNECQDEVMPVISNVVGGISNEEDNEIEINDEKLENINSYGEQSQDSIQIDDDSDEITLSNESHSDVSNAQTTHVETVHISNPKAKIKQNNFSHAFQNDTSGPILKERLLNNEVFPMITAVSSLEIETRLENDKDLLLKEEVKDQIPQVVEDSEDENKSIENNILKEPISVADELPSEMTFADDGIEFADDGIEYVEDEDQSENDETPPVQEEVNNESPPKFDLKLLMHPIVYTTRLDDMAVYKERSLFNTIDGKELVSQIMFESKPTSAKSVNFEIEVENQGINEVDDDLFQNNSSVESDDDCIIEYKKVKLSSKLLQKPRSRSYNPIQLCKNPDFNTRLKRLTVGFFSSSRNRALLQACKPMTIDLSKAFESKLVGSTMYLKPSDQVIKPADDILSESNSIMPSAMAVQSLMDNTNAEVDRILQEELNKRMLERNKTINLPNISVVRQINQKLLMAEVSPIMAQLDTNIPLTHKAAIEKENLISHENGVTLEPDVNLNKQLIESRSTLLTTDDKVPVNIETNTTLNVKQISINETPRNMANQVIADNNKSKMDKTLDNHKKKVRQKNIPTWITKSYGCETQTKSDLLLTIDTLYKMLNTLDPNIEYILKSKKKKNKKVISQSVETCSSVCEIIDCDALDTHTEESVNKKNDLTVNPKRVREASKNKKRRYCCWAKTKLEKMKGNVSRLNRHRCPLGACTCCCEDELNFTLRKKEADRINIRNTPSYDIDAIDNAIEHVVKQWREESKVEVEQPAVHIVNVDNSDFQPPLEDICDASSLGTVYVENNAPEVTIHKTNAEPEFPTSKELNGKEVTIAREEASVPPLSKINSSPTPVIRVYSGSGSVKEGVPKAVNVPEVRNLIHGNRRHSVIDRYPNPKYVNNNMTPKLLPKLPFHKRTIETPTKYQFSPKVTEGSNIPCLCRPNVAVEKSSSTLLVDGSNECLRHPKSRVSKETRIYLNRKHMSATERPFYVGKNKILLTNVKQPKPQITPPTEQVPFTLPYGVQVILLPDGTITYLVDPNVELTLDQIDAMPLILYAIQQQINASGITLPVPVKPLPKTFDTIDLDDEPDLNTGITNIHRNENINTDGEQTKEHNSGKIDVSTVTSGSTSGNSSQRNEDSHSIVTGELEECNLSGLNKSPWESGNNDENQELCTNVSNSIQNVNEAPMTSNEDTTSNEGNGLVNKVMPSHEHNYTLYPEKHTGDLTTTESNTNNTDAACAQSRNLLSDLMEMSGILEEDVALVSQEPRLQQPSSSLMIPEDPTIEPIILSIPDMSLPQPTSIPSLSPIEPKKHTISALIDDKVHELNPITSFAELKYACDHDGLFFKLDLSNGVMVPINVCIQKNSPEQPSRTSTGNNQVTPSEVIDLTDELGNAINDEVTSTAVIKQNKMVDTEPDLAKITARKLTSMMLKNIYNHTQDKNTQHENTKDKNIQNKNTQEKNFMLKLQLAKASNLAQLKEVNDRKKQELLKRLSNNLKPMKLLQAQKRTLDVLNRNSVDKFNLPRQPLYTNKVEAKIDLVDSDAPMEEEYLIDDSSEDSDDEPLSKIAKRKRTPDVVSQVPDNTPQNEQDIQDESAVQEQVASQDVDFEEAIDSIEPAMPVVAVQPTAGTPEPVPTQLVLSGAALNEPIILNDTFITSQDADDEDSQDCILGF